MSGAPARAPLPAPDLKLLAALYVLEASAWLAVVASYGSGARALLAFPTGVVFLVACLATLAASVIIVRRYRARAGAPRRFGLTIALNLVPVLLLLAIGEATVRLMSQPTPRGLVFAKTVLLPHSWRDVAARNEAVLARLRAEGSHLAPDGLLGWVLGPDRRSADGLYMSSVEGIRSARKGDAAATRPSRQRVALVGDSFTFGLDVSYEDSWGGRLERSLGPDVQVLNFGVEAYGVDQAYLRYLRDVRPWRPQVVILGLIDHDLLRSMAVYFFLSFPGWDYPFAKPRFAAERGDLRLLNAPLPSPEAIAVTPSIRELPFVEYDPGYRAEEWIWRPLDHSYLHRFAVSKYRDLVVASRPAEDADVRAEPRDRALLRATDARRGLAAHRGVLPVGPELPRPRQGSPLAERRTDDARRRPHPVYGHDSVPEPAVPRGALSRRRPQSLRARRQCGGRRVPARQRPGAALGSVSPGGPGEPAVTTNILGISAFYHDSAACLVRDGEIIAAAQEERFTRKKHDPGFPIHAVRYCLREGRVALGDLRYVAFYDKPLVKLERLLETYLSFAPSGIRSFVTAMPVWLKEKMFLKRLLQKELLALTDGGKASALPPLLFGEHHESHAASAFYPSPFTTAAVLCMDGVGEWATTSAWLGDGSELTPLWEIPFPHSIGLLYSAFTYYLGFKVNSGEYKVMGLAPYGRPQHVKAIFDHLLDLKPDGTFRLNMEYFDYCTGLTMTSGKFHTLFGAPPREPETLLTQREMDLARSIQDVTEEVMLRLARTLHRETGTEHLCLAGGVALNCVGNGKVLRDGPFRSLWIQPAAGDAGGAVGVALSAWHRLDGQPRVATGARDGMRGGLLGPAYSNEEIELFLARQNAPYVRVPDEDLFGQIADDLAAGKIIGWFQGRMEFGPRALGGRSILGDARNPRMQSVMNLKIKYRESFRPFAPSVLRERLSDYFEMDADSPYMLLVAPVLAGRRTAADR